MHQEHPIIDPAAAARLQALGGDRLLRQMIRLYVDNARERLQQIDGGLSPGGELVQAEAAAHSLKSSAANVGAMQVSALASAMETAALGGDGEAVRGLRDPLGDALAEAEARLNLLAEGLGE